MAGCLLLGAGFLIKLDATGPCGKLLECSEGVLAAFERYGSRVRLDSIARGMIAANALGRVSRAAAPVMQGVMPLGGYQRGPSVGPGSSRAVQIQGETLRTWAFKDPAVEKVNVDLSTVGRPLEATVEVWNAAGNTPVPPLRAPTLLQLQNRGQLKADR